MRLHCHSCPFRPESLGIVDARGSGSGFRLILGTIFIGIIPDGDGTICNRIARAGLGRSSYRICSAIGHRYVGHCNSGGVVPGDLECDLGGIVSDRNADLCLTDIDVTGIGNSILLSAITSPVVLFLTTTAGSMAVPV